MKVVNAIFSWFSQSEFTPFQANLADPDIKWIGLETLEQRQLLSASPLITEFMASNDSTINDVDGDSSDWIELYNPTDNPILLDGWFLTDNATNLEQWQFPDVTLQPSEYLLVFASNKNRAIEGQELHTNFKLAATGEYLALVEPDGMTIAHEFTPQFPVQSTDVSFGLAYSSSSTTLLPEGDEAHYIVPSSEIPNWNTLGFDDDTWDIGNAGFGFETSGSDFAAYIDTEIPSGISSLYLRHDFNVTDIDSIDSLTLNVRYDDGFIAYLNGVQVAQVNEPAVPLYNSTATDNHQDSDAVEWETFNLSAYTDQLVTGNNVLAIQALNRTADSSDMLIEAMLTSSTSTLDINAPVAYMTVPTPGTANIISGPIITEVTDNPAQPTSTDDLLITARISENFNGIASINLIYRINFDPESSMAMFDDGTHGDLTASDGIYANIISASNYNAGDMVRWAVAATDNNGTLTRVPSFIDQTGTSQSPQYFGTMIVDPTVNSQLPTLYWFVEDTSAANTRTGTRASLYYNGEFYDNIYVRIRGNSSQSLNKKSYKFDFNSGHHFRYDPNERRAEEINVNTTYTDKAYIRQNLAFEIYDLAGAPGSVSFPLRMQQNGEFFSVATFIEQPDEDMLKREELDPNGALYKMYNGVTSGTSGVEKKTRTEEDNSDLISFVSNINSLSGQALENYIFDSVDIAATMNYLVGSVLTQNGDAMRKNYYLYRDSDGTGEWMFLPWDLDLTFGRHFMTDDSILDDTIWADKDYVLGGRNQNVPISPSHPFVGSQQYPANRSWNRLMDALYKSPKFTDLYLRRLRTVMDDLLQAPGTPNDQLWTENRIDEWVAIIAPDVQLDIAKWGQYDQSQTLNQAVDILKQEYLAVRRTHLFETHLVDNAASYNIPYSQSALIPNAQPTDFSLQFGALEYNPASGNQDQEYIVIHNPNNYAVDISNWTLEGGVTHTFKPGTVITANGDMYLTPDSAAFRSRTTGPSGNQGLLVQSSYNGHLSNFGETLTIKRTDGTTAAETSYAGDPSPEQLHLRVTEIHYNPTGATATELAAGFDDGDMFEFIELLNTSATETLDLAGVNFSTGITFTFGATSLLPGERIVVVRNQAAFEQRYGTGVNIAGEYVGKLSNSGEDVKIDDATGSTIQSFEYNDNDNWPGRADGDGSSLIVVDIAGNYDSGDNWDSSLAYNGTPGTAPLNRDATILVNEVLAHTDLPQRDAIELHNLTGAAIDISGWYLSDSTSNYLKYRINDNTILGSDSYIAFDENDFNPGDGANATDFALSEFGDDVYLVAADASGKPIRFVDHVSFGATANGVALGRVNNTTDKLFPLAQNNFGQANGAHQVGTIVISEINYNPAVPAGSSLASDQLEFVELHNPTGLAVDLEGYRISGGIDLVFAAGTTLNASETALAVSFDPVADPTTATAFRDAYGIDETVQLIGTYTGVLDNGGETVKIEYLMEEGLDNGQLLVDRVIYDDDSPWPIEADGTGDSLQRTAIQNYGDDSASWLADVPTPGTVPQSIILGDINGDGLVNGFDVDPFVNVLLNGPYNAAADMNGDGSVDGFDVDPFVNAVLNGSAAPAPVEEVVEDEATVEATPTQAPVQINNFASDSQDSEEDQTDTPTPLIDMLPAVDLV